MNPAELFWAKVEKTDGCWLWIGARKPNGYGNVKRRPLTLLAHRVAYELVIGPIPAGMTVDHLCRVRHCVNPAHMELVSGPENTRRKPDWSDERRSEQATRNRNHAGWQHTAEAKRKISARRRAAA